MGLGIATESGASPLDTWGARLNYLGDEQLAGEARALLRGEVVVSHDDGLQIGWLPSADPHLGRLTLRRDSAPYVADLEIQAVLGRTLDEPDVRLSFPCPESWRVVDDDDVVRWELFNCLVHSVRTRDNRGPR